MFPDKQLKVIISYRCFKISAESCMKFSYKLIDFYIESQNCFTIPYHPLDNYINISVLIVANSKKTGDTGKTGKAREFFTLF